MRVLPVPARVPVPKVVAPSLKVTVPVGAVPVTEAVKVMDVPNVEGFRLEATVVVVATAVELTTWLNAADVTVLLRVSPAYTAVMLWLATLRVVVA